MEILANIFEKTKKRFAMEEPGYDGIRTIFANHGFQLFPVPVEPDGISVNGLQNLKTELLYVTPSHQFPTGTFSKSLAPFMRLAYLVFPKALMERYLAYYHRYNAQVTPYHQLAFADFIATGNYERHINRLRTAYRKKQAALLSAIDQIFGNKITVSGGGAGIHLLLDVKSSLTQSELIERAASAGIQFYSTKVLYMNPAHCPRSQLLLGFPTVPETAFLSILKNLSQVWELQQIAFPCFYCFCPSEQAGEPGPGFIQQSSGLSGFSISPEPK